MNIERLEDSLHETVKEYTLDMPSTTYSKYTSSLDRIINEAARDLYYTISTQIKGLYSEKELYKYLYNQLYSDFSSRYIGLYTRTGFTETIRNSFELAIKEDINDIKKTSNNEKHNLENIDNMTFHRIKKQDQAEGNNINKIESSMEEDIEDLKNRLLNKLNDIIYQLSDGHNLDYSTEIEIKSIFNSLSHDNEALIDKYIYEEIEMVKDGCNKALGVELRLPSSTNKNKTISTLNLKTNKNANKALEFFGFKHYEENGKLYLEDEKGNKIPSFIEGMYLYLAEDRSTYFDFYAVPEEGGSKNEYIGYKTPNSFSAITSDFMRLTRIANNCVTGVEVDENGNEIRKRKEPFNNIKDEEYYKNCDKEEYYTHLIMKKYYYLKNKDKKEDTIKNIDIENNELVKDAFDFFDIAVTKDNNDYYIDSRGKKYKARIEGNKVYIGETNDYYFDFTQVNINIKNQEVPFIKYKDTSGIDFMVSTDFSILHQNSKNAEGFLILGENGDITDKINAKENADNEKVDLEKRVGTLYLLLQNRKNNKKKNDNNKEEIEKHTGFYKPGSI